MEVACIPFYAAACQGDDKEGKQGKMYEWWVQRYYFFESTKFLVDKFAENI